MRHFTNRFWFGPAAAVLAFSSLNVCAASTTDIWQTPAVHGYGKIHPILEKKSDYAPSVHEISKVVFSIKQASEKPSEINSQLDCVARAINLYVADGVPLDHMSVVAIVSGAATTAMLDNTHYHERFGVDNPNLPLITALRAAGVDVVVSAQSVAKNELNSQWIVNGVKVALSSITAVTALEQKGYVQLPI